MSLQTIKCTMELNANMEPNLNMDSFRYKKKLVNGKYF